MIKFTRLDALALSIALCSGLLLFVIFGQRGFDDPYITYRYAWNIAAGHGPVYNLGERVLSTTAPFYAITLAPFALFGADLPLISNLISALSLGLGGAALWRLGQIWRLPIAGLVAGLLYPFFPFFGFVLGGEASFMNALILWGFVFMAAERYYFAVLLLALATLTRADGALAAGCAAIYLLIERYRNAEARQLSTYIRNLPWGSALLYLALIGPWFLFSWLYYGHPFPVTLATKQRQALISNSQSFSDGLFGLMAGLWSQPPYAVMLICALIGLCAIILRQRAWLLPIVWCGLYLLAYSQLGVTSYFWYYTPALVALIIAAGVGVATLAELLQRSAGKVIATLGLILVLCLFLGSEISGLLGSTPDTRLMVYRQAGEWLAAQTPADASVGGLEVGIIGYYAKREMIDFAGLLQPEISLVFSPTAGYAEAARAAVAQYQPDYLVLPETAFPLWQINADLSHNCLPVISFSDQYYPSNLAIYHCYW